MICLIGDIVVDVTLNGNKEDTKLRMGGIVHAARGLWAMGIPYCIAYFSPSYLDSKITQYLVSLDCQKIIKLGDVQGCPYVFLVEEAKEIGDQGYDFLLREEISIAYDENNIKNFLDSNYSHYLFISGNYNLDKFKGLKSDNISIDIANNINNISQFSSLELKFRNIFISTSSDLFISTFKESFEDFSKLFENRTCRLILKENRGGSRCYDFELNKITESFSQVKSIVHSIGVGDVYDVSFIVHTTLKSTIDEAMIISSWIAAEYASTTFPDDFKRAVARILKVDKVDLVKMKGVSLPWEKRNDIHIYLAAPDFDFVDTKHLEQLERSLFYHNFVPHRPVKENGQMEKDASKERRFELFNNDMILLDKCEILIAVLLYNDPGTLIEIGLSSAKGIPTLVYDPYNIANNCMLTELPLLVTSDIDEILTETFLISSKLRAHGESK